MTPKKNPTDLSAAQRKLVAEALCAIAVARASSGHPVPQVALSAVRAALTTEILALNAPAQEAPPT